MFEAGRGVGFTEAVHGLASEPVVVFFAILTQLGDVWFLFLVGGVLYVAGDQVPRWGIDRRRGLFVLGLLLTYVALIGVLKPFFNLPRPPGASQAPPVAGLPAVLEAAFVSITTAEGLGFPSGHALGTTMVWGGFALVVVEDDLSRAWLGVAAAVVATVSLARIVLGVHYLVDVVAGAALGAVALGALYVASDRGRAPGRVLVVAVAFALLGLGYGVNFESAAALGSGVGAWLVWRGVADSTPAYPSSRRVVVGGFVIFALAGGLFALLYALEPAPLVTFVGAAVAVGGAVGAPLAGEQLLAPTE